MKALAIFLITLSATFSAFANDVDSVVKEIETENSARCTVEGQSIRLCLGIVKGLPPGWCYYTIGYNCSAHEGDFQLKVKVLDRYTNGAIVTKVRKTAIVK